jgi:hypothetical protein
MDEERELVGLVPLVGGGDPDGVGDGAVGVAGYEDGVPGRVPFEVPGLAGGFSEHVGAANVKGSAAKSTKGM